jgi:hypothetical protein
LVVTPPYIAINTMQTMASSTNNGSMNPRFYEVLAHQAGIQKKDQQKAGLCTCCISTHIVYEDTAGSGTLRPKKTVAGSPMEIQTFHQGLFLPMLKPRNSIKVVRPVASGL